MTGYEAFGRVQRGRVAAMPLWATQDSRAIVDGSLDDAADASVGPAVDAPVHDWLAALREQWSMTTFFLFDPDSWR